MAQVQFLQGFANFKVMEIKMNFQMKQPGIFIPAMLLLVLGIQPGMAQESQTSDDGPSQQFGGPASVPGQLADDARLKKKLPGRGRLQDYFDWKDRLREQHRLNFSVDYSVGARASTNTLWNEDSGAGGAARWFGSATLPISCAS